jgi:hypothetical protein
MPPISKREHPNEFYRHNLFGVYVASISLLIVVTWLILPGLRRIAVPLGLLLVGAMVTLLFRPDRPILAVVRAV